MATKRAPLVSTPASQFLHQKFRRRGHTFKRKYAAEIASGKYDASKTTHLHKRQLKAIHRESRNAGGAGKYPGYDRNDSRTLAFNPDLAANYAPGGKWNPGDHPRDDQGRFT